MVKNLVSLVVVGAYIVSITTGAIAQGKKPKPNPTCPVCHMTLSSTKDDKTPVAVKAGKKVFYCCSACDMKDWKKDKKGNLILPKPKK